jgi:hypothetical protein
MANNLMQNKKIKKNYKEIGGKTPSQLSLL